MALDPILEIVGALGNRLAQQHFATTGDNDGVLPWLPTDADRQALVNELGRAPTLEEERFFENGYRESMLRLDGNARSPELAGAFWAELLAVLGRYGYSFPPEGTPEREEARHYVRRLLRDLTAKLESFTVPGRLAPTVRESDAKDAASSAPTTQA